MTIAELAALTLTELRAPLWRRAFGFFFIVAAAVDLGLVLLHPPGQTGAWVLLALLVFGLLATLSIAVAALRRSTASPRPAWHPDSAWLVYCAVHTAIEAIGWFFAPTAAKLPAVAALAVGSAFSLLLIVPLAPWLVAIAVERPLAASPTPFLGAAGHWLLPLLTLNFAFVLPLDVAQVWLLGTMVATPPGTVEMALIEAALSALASIIALALAVVAYRSVAPR